MNNRNVLCVNSRTTNCNGIVVERGNIFCDNCIELRKTTIKNKRDNDIDNLLEKNCILDQELQKLRSELQIEKDTNNDLRNSLKSTTLQFEEIKNKYEKNILINSGYLEQEVQRLNSSLEKITKENENLFKYQTKYEIEYNQNKLDLEKVLLENEKYKSIVEMLSRQSTLLKNENEEFSKLNSELSLELQKKNNN